MFGSGNYVYNCQMKTKTIEIEIKVKVENSKSLDIFLKKNGKYKGNVHQIDEYFIPSHRNFLTPRPIKEWFRLRDEEGKYSLNYKNYHFDRFGKSHHCDEYETNIDDLNQLRRILRALNFKFIVKVDKTRIIWTYKNYEIAIDLVKGLGNFVEIECIGRAKNLKPSEITDRMVKFLKDLDCGKLKRSYQGYPFLLLFTKEIKYEEL